jgi:FKBP-type peptidyl-prolyl cis-trans isomerase SlyD
VVGDILEVAISPEEGFGPHDPAMTFTDDIENVPPQFREIGAQVEMQNEDGEVKTFMVSRIEDGKLTVDGNHPFAGKNITFIVKVTEVRDATPDEINSGRLDEQPVIH